MARVPQFLNFHLQMYSTKHIIYAAKQSTPWFLLQGIWMSKISAGLAMVLCAIETRCYISLVAPRSPPQDHGTVSMWGTIKTNLPSTQTCHLCFRPDSIIWLSAFIYANITIFQMYILFFNIIYIYMYAPFHGCMSADNSEHIGAVAARCSHQWPFQEPRLEVPYIRPMYCKGYVREYPHKIWPYMVQYLHFRILELDLWVGLCRLSCNAGWEMWWRFGIFTTVLSIAIRATRGEEKRSHAHVANRLYVDESFFKLLFSGRSS